MISTIPISLDQINILLSSHESHFLDFKSKEISPAKLSRTISGFANSDGGDIFVGIKEEGNGKLWDGFSEIEDANGIVQLIDEHYVVGDFVDCEFLWSESHYSYVLKIQVQKAPAIMRASNNNPYVRKGAQNTPYTSPEQLRRLELDKGVWSFEDNRVDVEEEDVANSEVIIEFMLNIVPQAEPEEWLRKQKLIRERQPRVAGVVLFADEPQASLPRTSIKIYRYETDDQNGSRATLAFNPISVDGPVYNQVRAAVEKTASIIEDISVLRDGDLLQVSYPREAIHEIITNALIHRDYSINDDIHVRIFNNRIEVQSPGRLPGHITRNNILKERFSRNPKIVRLLNKFPDAPNKDVGEGLNTAFEAMRALDLKNPEIVEQENSVLVYIRHEPLAGHEETILAFLARNGSIGNAKSREICNVNSESIMRKTFKKLIEAGLIERVPEKKGRAAAYQLTERGRHRVG